MEKPVPDVQPEGPAMTRPTDVPRRALILGAPTLLMASAVARAAVHIELNQPNIVPLPIAIPPFVGAQPNDQQVGRDIAQVVSADLERSGLFQPLDARAFIQQITDVQTQPRFGDWRLINAQALVSGGSETQPDGRLKVSFRLWDVIAGEQLDGTALTSTPQTWRRMAHLVADKIYKRITGEDGYFDTRIVYISE